MQPEQVRAVRVNHEADDAIASYLTTLDQDDRPEVRIVSNDRDLWQLIDRRTMIEATVKKQTRTIDRHACKQLIGAYPEKVRLKKALLGDSSDNIHRAVPRIKTASLLRLCETAKGEDEASIKTAVKHSELTETERKAVLAHMKQIQQNLSIVRLWADLQLRQRTYKANPEGARSFLDEQDVSVDHQIINLVCGEKI